MTGIRATMFRGEAPIKNRRALPDTHAFIATNCKIKDGGLIPYLQPLLTADISFEQDIKTMWRYINGDTRNWLVWDKEVHAVGSPIAQDNLARIYWTGDSEPRMAAYNDAIASPPYPSGFYVLGVESPKMALTVSSVTGGTLANVNRAYVHTLVTQYQEESGPSAATLFAGKPDGTWNLSGFGALPLNSWSVTSIALSGGFATVTISGDLYGTSQYEAIKISGATGVTKINDAWQISEVISPTQFRFSTTLTGAVTGVITATRVAAHNLTGMKRRIYRSESSGSFLLVAEQDAATPTFADNIPSTNLSDALNEDIRTPPKNGRGLVSLPNGVHVMLAGNEICFSEPFKPHSYPTSNRYARSERGVALVPSQNNVIVLTDTYPIIAVATQPEAVSFAVMTDSAPCLSTRGVVAAGGGAIYPSYDGLWLVNSSQAVNLTDSVMGADPWKMLLAESFVAAVHDQTYYAQVKSKDGSNKIFVFDLLTRDSVIYVEYESTAIYSSPIDKQLYVAKDGNLLAWDSDERKPMTMHWRGKEHQMLKPLNLSVAQVYAEYDKFIPPEDDVLAANIALMQDSNAVWLAGASILSGDGIIGFGIQDYSGTTEIKVVFQLIDDQRLKFFKTLTNDRSFKLPKGYKSDKLSLAISANTQVFDMASGETITDLRQV